MAKFLTTQGVSADLLRIIQDAKKRIVLISPYLQINHLIKAEIEYKVKMSRDIEVWLIYREDKLRPNDREWLDSMPSIKTGLLKNLHAKCYMNEKEAILTSMNLYEYSQNNNNEMGILISSRYLGNDNDVYKEIYEESLKLAMMSGIIQGTTEPDKMSEPRDGVSGFFRRFTTQPNELEESSPSPETLVENTREEINPSSKTPAARTRKEATPVLEASLVGFCIRCKAELPANPTRPYCSNCYAIWKRYKNEGYKENYCHICGSEYTTTLLKPLCLTCDRELEDVLEFIAF